MRKKLNRKIFLKHSTKSKFGFFLFLKNITIAKSLAKLIEKFKRHTNVRE
jgi:hypothetical protein